MVLHFLESRASITRGLVQHPLLEEVQELGLSSLVVDYKGVGASDGSTWPPALDRDASLVYSEAVRRAGGESRVIIRATSLGTLATASLLARGHSPACIVLIAPVRAETVVKNWSSSVIGEVPGFLLRPLVSPPLSVDLVEQILRTRGHLALITPEEDFLLSSDEQELLEEAVYERAMGWITLGRSHVELCIQARARLFPLESGFYRVLMDREIGE